MAPRLELPLAGPLVAYLVVCLALLSSRLFSILHTESAAAVAFVAFFVSGLHVLWPSNRGVAVHRMLVGHLLLLLVPLSLLTISMFWVPNCAYWTGLLLYIAYTAPSVILGVALASWIRTWRVRWKRLIFVAAGGLVVVGGVIYDLGFHPQFYVLNHVFGAILGPIYEESLYIRPALFVFRALTLMWALLFFLLGSLTASGEGRVNNRSASIRYLLPVLILAIALTYLLSFRSGLNTSYRAIEATLGSVARSAHFDIYYDPASFEGRSIQRVVADHEFEYERLRQMLKVEPSARIRSYLYPTLRQKLVLTGAGVTDVSPVWLSTPQMHILFESYPSTLGHELAHVFSREFGFPILRASPLAGLVEGLAVAVQAPDGRPSVHQQVSVAERSEFGRRNGGVDLPLSRRLVSMLDPISFWTGRGAVSYTTTGSFVRFLLDQYGPEGLHDAYASGDFERGFGTPLTTLAHEWEMYLKRIPVISIGAWDLVYRRFTIPSLFEKRCPHYLPRHVMELRQARDCLAVRDTTGATAHLEKALEQDAEFSPALALWAKLFLERGDFAAVVERIRSVPDSRYIPALRIYYGDALALAGESEGSLIQYSAAEAGLPRYERDTHVLIMVRRLLVKSPGSLSLLYAPREHLGSVPEAPEQKLAYSIRLASISADAEAAELMARVEWEGRLDLSRGDERLLRRMLNVWTARLYSSAGNHTDAEQAYVRALVAARIIGDHDHAEELEHLVRKTRWLAAAAVEWH